MEIPFFFLGTPSGHDVEFHLYSWLDVLAQWKHGILFPRWAAAAHFTYGEPRFLFYPPASWMLGAFLSAVVPWKFAASVYIWIALTLAGMSMFALARRCFPDRDAVVAAVLYAVNPYHLVIVYWRSAFAELLASCLVPLLVLLLLKAAEDGRRVLIPLSLLLAAAWLTNAPAALMIHYSLALLCALVAWQQRSARCLYVGAGAVALGACLAAFYLLPAIYEQRWINIAEAVSAGSRPLDNFLFVHTTDADHDKFNRIISWLAVWEMAVIAVLAVAAKISRRLPREAWAGLCIWAGACSLMMFPQSLFLWNVLPKLEFMQFPWRWLLCLSAIYTLLVIASLPRWWMRASVFLVGIFLIAAVWNRIQPPWWDNAADLKEMQDNMADRIGYEGTDEYTPAGADPSSIDKDRVKDSPYVTALGAPYAAIHVTEWSAEKKSFTAEMPSRDQLAVRLFGYPAWRVQVNGRAVQADAREGTGQILIPVEAGMNRVEVSFIRTWDRAVGGWISVVSFLCTGTWIALKMKKTKAL